MAHKEEVCTFMQQASKATRSYFVNASGLKGFLVSFPIVRCLKRAIEQKKLQAAIRYQNIDMDALFESLN